ncbi:MAG TPA: oligopeptide/dipeptide ABC transporter ATP-binding protein [Actinomycetales bacterium]|nr:oligopeptide/dipeptide ABC transporter ATP-binding protein [Actinomycetales bacterium]
MSLLELKNIHHVFRRGGKRVHAVNGLTLSVGERETVAVIGESGSGKSTLGRIALGLIRPTQGEVVFDGTSLTAISSKEMRSLRADLQVVFQEPYESLNPRIKVGDIVSEPLLIHGTGHDRAGRRAAAIEVLERVGLKREHASRYPKQLSGGQQQRVGIARAIITRPRLVVLDEPTSSLDMSVRAKVLDLLRDLQRQEGMSYVFVSHDLATVATISDRVAVMYLGQVVEQGPTREVLSNPRHPYTWALLSAALSTDPSDRRPYVPLRGEIPSLATPPRACVLSGRCPIELPECSSGPIADRAVAERHVVRCIRAHESPALLSAQVDHE